MSRLLEVCGAEIAYLQAIPCGEDKVIEGTESCKQIFDSPLVRHIDHFSMSSFADRFYGRVDFRGVAGRDHDLESLGCREFGYRQAYPRRTAQDNYPSLL